MSSFVLYSVILLALALLFIVVPLVRYQPKVKAADSEIRKQKNIEVFEQSLAELEQDRAEELIAADDFERLQAELQRSFLRDMEDEKQRQKSAAIKSGKWLPVLCLLVVPLFSYSLYDVVGSARDLELAGIMESLTSAETADEQLVELNRLADFLQQRFELHEDDIQNGYMLGTLYLELENFDAAIATFRTMIDQMEDGVDKASVLGQLAQSMYLANDSNMNPEIQAVIGQALELNPNEFAVMSLLAIEAFINQDFDQALAYWRRQLLQLDNNSNQANALRNRIAQVEALLPQTASEANQGNATAATDGASVTLVVDLAPSVRDRLGDYMTLYVFARRAEGGPPVAAQNLPLTDFPLEITLDDSMAMLTGNNLSSAQNIFVGARLSKSGQAIAQPGDVQAVSEPFELSAQQSPVQLTISEIVQ